MHLRSLTRPHVSMSMMLLRPCRPRTKPLCAGCAQCCTALLMLLLIVRRLLLLIMVLILVLMLRRSDGGAGAGDVEARQVQKLDGDMMAVLMATAIWRRWRS